MRKPEVGDRVKIEGVVDGYGTSNCVYIKTPNNIDGLYVDISRISEVIPKSWEPKVGDKVRHYQDTSDFNRIIVDLFEDRMCYRYIQPNGKISYHSCYFDKKEWSLCVD